MQTIYHLFNVPAGKQNELVQALTSAEGIASWWTTKTETNDNGNYLFHFDGGYHKEFETVSESDGKVEWKCINAHPDWVDTRVTFEWMENDGKLMVNFHHSNWKEQNAMFGICNYHWALYMKSLKDLVTTGRGNPTVVQ